MGRKSQLPFFVTRDPGPQWPFFSNTAGTGRAVIVTADQ